MNGAPLLLATLSALVLLLLLIVRWKLHPFIALLVSALALGIISGMRSEAILTSLQKGMADLLGSIALIIGAGAILGRIIEVSGGGEALARSLIRALGAEHISWALLLAAFLVGIPVFFDVAFFALIPLVWSITKQTRKSLLLYALPVLSALTATHALIPTHPGPAAVARLLGADLGKMILYGFILAVPMTVVGGITYGVWIGKKIFIEPPKHLAVEPVSSPQPRPPRVLLVVGTILLPVLLIGLAATLPGVSWIGFMGSVPVALLAAAVFALVALGVPSGLGSEALLRHTAESLNSVGSLILIVGASGALKQVILDCGAGSYFGMLMLRSGISPLLIGFLVGAALRLALGSATAAIVTAGGFIALMVASFPGVNTALMALAVAIGGSTFSHVNDAGFWMVKEYCGMDIRQTLQSYSIMKAITSVTGLFALLILSLFV